MTRNLCMKILSVVFIFSFYVCNTEAKSKMVRSIKDLGLDLSSSFKIVKQRSDGLCRAIKNAGYNVNPNLVKSTHESLDKAVRENNIFDQSNLWHNQYYKVIEDEKNPSRSTFLTNIQMIKSTRKLSMYQKGKIFNTLKENLKGIDLKKDQDSVDLFYIDMVNHLAIIALNFDIMKQLKVITEKEYKRLLDRLKDHDKTKVFDKDADSVNTKNLQGYMLAPLFSGLFNSTDTFKDNGFSLPMLVRKGGPLHETPLAEPILCHVFNERHHPEYYFGKSLIMDSISRLEFIADGLAAGMRGDRCKDMPLKDHIADSSRFWLVRLGVVQPDEKKDPPFYKAIYKSWVGEGKISLKNEKNLIAEINKVTGAMMQKLGDEIHLSHYLMKGLQSK